MTINNWTALSAALAEEARSKIAGASSDIDRWLLNKIATARADGTPSWVFEQSVKVFEDYFISLGMDKEAEELLQTLYADESKDELRRREAERDVLGLISSVVDHLLNAGGAEIAEKYTAEGIVLRGAAIEDRQPLQAFISRHDRRSPDDNGGSFSIFLGQRTALEPDVSYLLATDSSGAILAASAILPGKDHLTEVAPPLVVEDDSVAVIAELLTAVHCLHQAYFDPDKERRFWSAVPIGSLRSQAALRHCGFRPDSGVWKDAMDRLPEPISPASASWLSASTPVISRQLARMLLPPERADGLTIDLPMFEEGNLPRALREVGL